MEPCDVDQLPVADYHAAIMARAITDELRNAIRQSWGINCLFRLQSVYSLVPQFQNHFPHIRDMQMALRSALRQLRIEGFIEFIDHDGMYMRLLP